ncbi:MAG: hypothetical protein R3C19_22545 [Planctomycetaceae bacterium]
MLDEHRTGTNAYQQTFVFDPAGNRTLKNADGTRTTFAYDNANQLKYAPGGSRPHDVCVHSDGNQKIEQPPTGNRGDGMRITKVSRCSTVCRRVLR